MKRTALSIPALALAIGLLSGCGGSDAKEKDSSDSEPETSSISSADFVEQANQICADGTAEITAAQAEIGDAPTDEQITTFASDVLVPNIQAQHDAIAELGAPEGDEEAVDTLLTSLQSGVDALTADPTTITADPGPFADANAAATDLGLTDCAS